MARVIAPRDTSVPGRVVPVLSTFLFVVVSVVPLNLPGFAIVTPSFALMAVYHWSIYRPDLLPQTAVFALGEIGDAGDVAGRCGVLQCLLDRADLARRQFKQAALRVETEGADFGRMRVEGDGGKTPDRRHVAQVLAEACLVDGEIGVDGPVEEAEEPQDAKQVRVGARLHVGGEARRPRAGAAPEADDRPGPHGRRGPHSTAPATVTRRPRRRARRLASRPRA